MKYIHNGSPITVLEADPTKIPSLTIPQAPVKGLHPNLTHL